MYIIGRFGIEMSKIKKHDKKLLPELGLIIPSQERRPRRIKKADITISPDFSRWIKLKSKKS